MLGFWILTNHCAGWIQHDALVSDSIRIDRRLVTVKETAEALAIGRSNAYDLVLRGSIRSVLVGKRCRRVPVSAIDDYVRELLEQG